MFGIMKSKDQSKNQRSTWSPPKRKTEYPRWTFVKVEEDGSYHIIWDKTKLSFISERAFMSWNKPYLLVSKESISGYQTWKTIGFAPGTIIKSIIDGKSYFITGQLFEEEKRLISTPDFYNVKGFNPNLSILVSKSEIDFHNEGRIL